MEDYFTSNIRRATNTTKEGSRGKWIFVFTHIIFVNYIQPLYAIKDAFFVTFNLAAFMIRKQKR
jgi:hypothetical protein